MSSNIAKDTLLGTFENLLTCDGNAKADFIIESSEDGDREEEKARLHVHSSILTLRLDRYLKM